MQVDLAQRMGDKGASRRAGYSAATCKGALVAAEAVTKSRFDGAGAAMPTAPASAGRLAVAVCG